MRQEDKEGNSNGSSVIICIQCCRSRQFVTSVIFSHFQLVLKPFIYDLAGQERVVKYAMFVVHDALIAQHYHSSSTSLFNH